MENQEAEKPPPPIEPNLIWKTINKKYKAFTEWFDPILYSSTWLRYCNGIGHDNGNWEDNDLTTLNIVYTNFSSTCCLVRHSIVASIPACHAGDRGSIPRDGGFWLMSLSQLENDFVSMHHALGHQLSIFLLPVIMTSCCVMKGRNI